MLTKYFYLLWIILVVSPGFSHAEPFVWMQRAYARAMKQKPPECPTSLDTAYQFVFAFEGAEGYCPLAFWNSVPEPELDDWDTTVFLASRGLQKERLFPQFAAEMAKESESYNCNLESFIQVNLITTSRVIPETRTSVFEPDTHHKKILYYAWDQVSDARSCVNSLLKLAEVKKQSLQVSILGHSLGGISVKNFYESLPLSPWLNVKNILTVDPVPPNLKVVGSLTSRPFDISVETAVPFSSWHNFYQSSDDESFVFWPVFKGIHGVRLNASKQSIRNTWVTPSALTKIQIKDLQDRNWLTHHGHEAILYHSNVIGEYQSLIAQ